jgi:hypothetical protein
MYSAPSKLQYFILFIIHSWPRQCAFFHSCVFTQLLSDTPSIHSFLSQIIFSIFPSSHIWHLDLLWCIHASFPQRSLFATALKSTRQSYDLPFRRAIAPRLPSGTYLPVCCCASTLFCFAKTRSNSVCNAHTPPPHSTTQELTTQDTTTYLASVYNAISWKCPSQRPVSKT